MSEFWQGWWLIGAIHLLAAASPGPDFLFATRHTLRYGRGSGLWCSFGITLGLSVHLLYSLLGLAALIAASEGIMSAIRYLGGGYLIYLGIKGMRACSVNFEHGVAESASKPKPWKSVALGFGCNLFNPKAPLYFLSLFTVVLSPCMPLSWWLGYGIWIMGLQMGWFSLLVYGFSHAKVRRMLGRFGGWIERLLGGAMIFLGLKLWVSR